MHSYDIKHHLITFAGIVIDSGFGKDSVIKCSRESEAWDDEAGADGEVTRSKTNDDRMTVELTLMATSFKNDLLTSLYNLDKNTPGGIGGKPFALKDLAGTTKIFAEEAWLRAAPPLERSRKAGENVWKIRLANVKENYGGTT